MLNQNLFFNILNHFIHPQSPAPELNDLTVEDIPQMLSLAQVHSVYPVVFDEVRKTKAFQGLPEQVRHSCHQRMKHLVIGQAMRTSLFLQLYQILLQGGVTPLVVKGLVLRNLYAQPDYRASSDEDLLVRKEEFWKLDEILTSQGFTRELGEHPLQEHEITYWQPKTGIHLEIHLSLFPEESGAYGHLNGLFTQAFEHQTTEEIMRVGIHTLDPTEHMLYLICHGLKHFLHSGFGIRQVCDMVKFAECYGDRIDWERLTIKTRQEHIYVFWMNLFAIGEKYLGFSWKRACLQKPRDIRIDCEAMLEDLMDSGIYGKRTEERIHSSNMTLRAAQSGGRKGNLMAAMFPSLSYMKAKFPYLEHRSWLLPVAWGQRAVDYLRHSGKREIEETMNTGKRRVELLKKYGLIQDQTRGRGRK